MGLVGEWWEGSGAGGAGSVCARVFVMSRYSHGRVKGRGGTCARGVRSAWELGGRHGRFRLNVPPVLHAAPNPPHTRASPPSSPTPTHIGPAVRQLHPAAAAQLRHQRPAVRGPGRGRQPGGLEQVGACVCVCVSVCVCVCSRFGCLHGFQVCMQEARVVADIHAPLGHVLLGNTRDAPHPLSLLRCPVHPAPPRPIPCMSPRRLLACCLSGWCCCTGHPAPARPRCARRWHTS